MNIYKVLGNVLNASYVLKKLIIVTKPGIVRHYCYPIFQRIRKVSQQPKVTRLEVVKL